MAGFDGSAGGVQNLMLMFWPASRDTIDGIISGARFDFRDRRFRLQVQMAFFD